MRAPMLGPDPRGLAATSVASGEQSDGPIVAALASGDRGAWAESATVTVEAHDGEVLFRVRHRWRSWIGLAEVVATAVVVVVLAAIAFVAVLLVSGNVRGDALVGAAVSLSFGVVVATVSLPFRLMVLAGEERVRVNQAGVTIEWLPRRRWCAQPRGAGAGGRFRLETSKRTTASWIGERWFDLQSPGRLGALWLVSDDATESIRFGVGLRQADVDLALQNLRRGGGSTLVIDRGVLLCPPGADPFVGPDLRPTGRL